MRAIFDAFAYVFVLFALAHVLSGCGESQLSAQARAATITAGVLSAGGSMLDQARKDALDRVEAQYPNDPEHDTQLDLEAARWRPAGVAMDSARAALLTWIDSIELARVAGGDEDLIAPLIALGLRVIELYGQAVQVAAELGEELPTIPASARPTGGE